MTTPKIHSMRLVLQVMSTDATLFEGSTVVWLETVEYEDTRVFRCLDSSENVNDDELSDKEMIMALFSKLERLEVPSGDQLIGLDLGPDGSAPKSVLEILRNRLLSNYREGKSRPDPEAIAFLAMLRAPNTETPKYG